MSPTLRTPELPASLQVMLRHAVIETIIGHTDQAADELHKALEIDPLSPDPRAWLAQMLCNGRHFDEALAQALQLVELTPANPMAHSILGFVYICRREFERSVVALRKAVEVSGGMVPIVWGWLGLALGLGGQSSEARAVLDRLNAMAGQRFVPPTCFAWIHLGLGNIDEAFQWMDRAIDTPDRMMAAIKTYAFLDPIRSDPRFTALLHRMNLEN